jgi:hypothetical protein
MYQVTAMYEDSEVGYGEGESYEYAAAEASDSVSPIYQAEDVLLVCSSGILQVKTPLDLWRSVCG